MATCKKCGKKGLFLKVDIDGLCESCVHEEISSLRTALTPEARRYVSLKDEIRALETKKSEIEQEFHCKQGELDSICQNIEQKKKQVIQLDEQMLWQDFGLYEPKYDFCTSDEYNKRLKEIRQRQKDMIKAKTAVTGNMNWTVNGSKAQGRKMVTDMQKLLLRAFNSECEEVIDRVKYNNYETAQKRITSSWEAISKLGAIMSVSISKIYYSLKIEELTLAFEYRQKKQQEKEEQKELRARMREEARLQKEIEEARKKTEKEKAHYANALEKINTQLENASDSEREKLIAKKRELEEHLQGINEALQKIDYREANQKAGYVYVISNIGSFGENIYKIGMTRRLDPMDRVDELGDASVPFNFDVHAMIFSDDAPKLEAALHRAFEDRKVNMVNTRREFFHVTLDEIKAVVKANYDKTAEFIETAEAEQYRISMKMRSVS
ncbi:DUF4041 domain-containing protein [Solibaculum mannosilyticum]|uniref:DUF4041 domain-containing protein n=1 Tax=Solibaculum mannosilyticum TaxID=2780922 RepID=UPI0007A89450|nr:T5orf172 domain protein [Eubacteriaceae bacterium CHKCI005]